MKFINIKNLELMYDTGNDQVPDHDSVESMIDLINTFLSDHLPDSRPQLRLTENREYEVIIPEDERI